MTLRAIDPAPFRARYTGPASDAGERPELQWVKISRMRIDPRYQREIGRRGADNIVAIAPAFQWAKFAPVVAPIEGGLFAIIDGQHRATAAALRGFDSVPCVIIAVDQAAQADAFVAINANVTAMSPLQLHAARLAAGDQAAAALTAVCAEAGVTVCRYPVPANKMQPGETLAVAMLQSALDKYGREILIAALSCITKTRRGNPGMIRKQIVEALCAVLEAEPDLTVDRKALIFRMQTFDFAAAFNAARAKSIDSGDTVVAVLVEAIGAHLESKAGQEPPRGKEDQKAQARTVQAKEPVKPPQPAKPGAAAPARVNTGAGLSIGSQEISFNGRKVRVVPRAAALVGVLAKAMPSFVGDNFIIGRIWSVRPANAGEILDSLVSDLKILKQIGLEVRTQRGVGRQLVETS
ncbi:ParB N-terminal domain-containing protein [Bradyrhizobium sp. INPA03-11B]|uniref:ParB N-terminal domain-containing protein n=1 Tax=Bradyrhizobium sp. INPA03-11B TaxID=418598 RepID=UPI0033900FA8